MDPLILAITNVEEFSIWLYVAFFVTCLALFPIARKIWNLLFRLLAAMIWMSLAIFYTGLTTATVPAMGWFFFVIGLMFGLVLLKDLFMLWRARRWGEDPD